VGEDRLGQDEVEPAAEHGEPEVVHVAERGPLEVDLVLAHDVSDALLQDPPLRLDPEVTIGKQVGDEQPPAPERTAAEVEQGVVLAQPEVREQRELRGGHQVVPLGRADPRPVGPVAGVDAGVGGVRVGHGCLPNRSRSRTSLATLGHPFE
jgi:hypothetical protein